MVLATLAGWALQAWAGWSGALVLGVLAGFVAAQFVPAGACAVPRRSGERTDT